VTDFTTLTDAELISGKPALQSQARALRDNPIAIAEGSTGAPKISHEALYQFAPGTVVVASSDAEAVSEGSTYQKFKEIVVPRAGTLTVSFDLGELTGNSCKARIYVNGVAVGTERAVFSNVAYQTFTEDITVSAGDLVQLYGANILGQAHMKNFRLKAVHPWQFIVKM
jgi:hypothetical protein